MLDPIDHLSLFSQDDTTGHPSLALTCIDPNHSGQANSFTGHGAVDVNLSLKSASNFTSQNEDMPVLGQLGLHQHVAEAGIRRSNLNVPCGIHAHRASGFPLMSAQNTININIIMGSSSSININLPNNNTPSQFTRNNQVASSSSIIEVRNNVLNPASSNFKQPFSSLISYQELKPENEVASYSHYASPTATAVSGKALSTCLPNYKQKTPTAVSNLRHNIVTPCPKGPSRQSIGFQHHTIPQSNSDLKFCSLLSRYLPSEQHYLLASTMNPPKNRVIDFDGGRESYNKDQVHPQSNLRTPHESHPAAEHVSKQVSDPTTNNICLQQFQLQALPQAPQKDNMTEPQRNLSQAIIHNHRFDLDNQARRDQSPAVRRKSHPYVKYGPYTCPQCHAIFESGYCFAAHVQNHYKKESPAERKKRREAKIRKRDLRIAESTAGITVIPGCLQLEDELLVTSCISDEKSSKTNQEEGFAPLKIKEEVIANCSR